MTLTLYESHKKCPRPWFQLKRWLNSLWPLGVVRRINTVFDQGLYYRKIFMIFTSNKIYISDWPSKLPNPCSSRFLISFEYSVFSPNNLVCDLPKSNHWLSGIENSQWINLKVTENLKHILCSKQFMTVHAAWTVCDQGLDTLRAYIMSDFVRESMGCH